MKTIGFLLSGFMLMMLMGTVYSWSVFRVEVELVYGTNTLQSGLPYMTSLFFYALSMMVTGRQMTSKNTQSIVLIGVLLIVLGWFLAAQSNSLLQLTIGYGAFIGIGVGMAYGVPVYIVNQRYEKSGLYTGIMLSGFGASPLVTAPLVHYWVQNYGLSQTFLWMSGLSLIILMPLVLVFHSKHSTDQTKQAIEKPYSSKTFALLYILFLVATTIGLMMIGLSYRIGVVNYGFNVNHVAVSLSLFAVLNGISRPLFGWIIDKKGFIYSSTLSSVLILLAVIVAFLNQGNMLFLFAISMGLFWFNLGAWLAMLPASIKLYFGTHLYAKRYGLMFTAYGFGAIIGTVLSGLVLDVFVNTYYLYILVFGIVLFILYVITQLKKSASAMQ